MSSALVVTHSPTEGVANLGRWLEDAGLGLDVVEPWRGAPLPEQVGDHAALVVMGGPQQAYDDASAPWLRRTKELLRAAVRDGVPVLGVCLGAQLLAEATGGRVALGSEGVEAGARLVAKRDATFDDPLFSVLPLMPTVVQWHEDAIVDLPPGAVLLASSPRYAHQAFRIGERAWGLQFHVETDEPMVRHWAAEYGAGVVAAGQDPHALADRVVAELPEVEACWQPVAQRFAELATGRRPAPLPLLDR